MKISLLILVAVVTWRWFCALESKDGNEPKPPGKDDANAKDDRRP